MTEQETLSAHGLETTTIEIEEPSHGDSSIYEAASLLARYRSRILAGGLLFAGLGALASWLLPPSYKAEASILPPQQQQSSLASMMTGMAGGLAASMGSQLGLKSIGDLYIGILKSRMIADDIISRFNLMQVYRARRASDARKALSAHATFTSGKDSLIIISVSARDAKLAADIANAYIDELYKQNSRLAITDASQRRLFYEQRLEQEKEKLAAAEVALKATQESTGLLAPAGQAEVLIRSGAMMRAQITSDEVQLQTLRSFATEQNPQVEMLKQEIAALKQQLAQADSKGSGAKFDVPGGRLPESSLEYIRKLRDLKYHETLFELLAKQYEAARIDEAKQAPVLQVVDRAIVPDKDTRMRGLPLILGAGIFGLVVSVVGVLLLSRASQFAADFKSFRESGLAESAA